MGEHAFFRAAWDDGNAKGEARGRAEGKEEGKAEGMKLLLANLLSTRFGVLPEKVRASLDQASPDELEHWFNQALNASSLEAIFGQK